MVLAERLLHEQTQAVSKPGAELHRLAEPPGLPRAESLQRQPPWRARPVSAPSQPGKRCSKNLGLSVTNTRGRCMCVTEHLKPLV